MGKRTIIIFIVLLTMFACYSISNLSVDLDNNAYALLENAQTRGIIPIQSQAKPYSAKKIVSLLEDISSSSQISQKERIVINSFIESLMLKYGSEESTELKDIVLNGFYRKTGDNYTSTVGLFGDVRQSVGFTGNEILIDSRNGGSGYLLGSIKDNFSYLIGMELRIDKLDNTLLPYSEFSIPGTGIYTKLTESTILDDVKTIPMNKFGSNYSKYGEGVFSLLDDKVLISIGSNKHDWGPGEGNLVLSETAESFDSFQTSYEFSPWLRGSFIAGSLAIFNTTQPDNDLFVFGEENKNTNRYNTNYTAHRFELDIFKNLTVSLSESMVYERQFNWGYLNPFTVLFASQLDQGDKANCQAGLDIIYNIPGKVKLYAAFTCCDMYAFNELFKTTFLLPRNEFALQFGAKIPLEILPFDTLIIQGTYLTPFVYIHKLLGDDPDDTDETEETDDPDDLLNVSFLNKGKKLGYNSNQNSIEMLVKYETSPLKNLSSSCTVKYELRSFQYGRNSVSKSLNYDEPDKFAWLDPIPNIGGQSLFIQMACKWTPKDFPLSFNGALQYYTNYERDILSEDDSEEPTNLGECQNFGDSTVLSDSWERKASCFSITLGFTIYH